MSGKKPMGDARGERESTENKVRGTVRPRTGKKKPSSAPQINESRGNLLLKGKGGRQAKGGQDIEKGWLESW